MKLHSTFLHTKLARRIFYRFVLCALVPITVLAIISLRNVTAQLNEQSRSQLHHASREEAMAIYERLSFLEANMKLVATGVVGDAVHKIANADHSLGISSHLTGQFVGMEVATADGNHRVVFGNAVPPVSFTSEQLRFLDSGENILSTLPCGESQFCILLSRSLTTDPQTGILVAQIKGSYLWAPEELAKDVETCVLGPVGETLFCSANILRSLPPAVTQSFSGEFNWKANDREFVASFWNLPLASSFFVPHWTIVTSKAKSDVLAPLKRFKTSFLLVFLLAFWVVLLLSSVQIRRSLIPLEKLKESTRKISDGNFAERVRVDSGDEFDELATSFNVMARQVEKQLNSLKLVNEINTAILSAWDTEKVVDTLLQRLGELIPAELIGVNLVESAESLTVRSYFYEPGVVENQRHVQDIDISGEELLAFSKCPQVAVFTSTDPMPVFLRPLAGRGMKHFLTVSIVLDGHISAVFTMAHSSARPWTDEDKEHAKQLADHAAAAFSNSRLVNELKQLQWGTLTALARAIDAKSPWTLGHSERVTDCAVRIAEAMGLPAKELDIIRRGGLVHDVGKIGTPISILDKPGKLTDEEMTEMRRHVIIGARILQPIRGLADSMSIVLQHHEWINGGGYPCGLAGEQITLHARIFAVADCYDALVSDRPYRAGLPLERVMQILEQGSGKQFDPSILQVFRNIVEKSGPHNHQRTPEAVVVS
jgi:putative nucleotidyltransferase with HDIG domain